jgi:hypothetical protein
VQNAAAGAALTKALGLMDRWPAAWQIDEGDSAPSCLDIAVRFPGTPGAGSAGCVPNLVGGNINFNVPFEQKCLGLSTDRIRPER